MRFCTIAIISLFLFTSCNAQPEASNTWVKGPEQGVGELYSHKTVNNASLIVLSFAELNKTSAGPFPGAGKPEDQLARVYEVMGMDALIDDNSQRGSAFVEWGEAFLGDDHKFFAARLQPEGQGGKVFMMVTLQEDFDEMGGENLLFDDPLKSSPAPSTNRPVAATTAPLTKDYPPLLVKRDRRGTELSNNWQSGHQDGLYASANDPNSPRLFSLNVMAKQARSTKEAIDYTLRKMGVQSPQYLELTRMKPSKELLGSDHFITVGQSTLNGRKAHLFISSSKAKGTDVYRVSFRETPMEVYQKWGGIASILVSEGIVNNTSSFGNTLGKVAQAGPRQQVKVYEAAYTKIMYKLAQGIMMAQASTTMRMMELNYDLLLGGDITDPFIGN